MLAHPFFRSEYHKFFPNFVKDCRFIFTIFEAKGKARKIEFLHGTKIVKF